MGGVFETMHKLLVAAMTAIMAGFKGLLVPLGDLTPDTAREWFRKGIAVMQKYAALTATKLDDTAAAAAMAVVNDEEAWRLILEMWGRQSLKAGCPCPGPCPDGGRLADLSDTDVEAALLDRIAHVAPVGINPSTILAILQAIMDLIQKLWPQKVG